MTTPRKKFIVISPPGFLLDVSEDKFSTSDTIQALKTKIFNKIKQHPSLRSVANKWQDLTISINGVEQRNTDRVGIGVSPDCLLTVATNIPQLHEFKVDQSEYSFQNNDVFHMYKRKLYEGNFSDKDKVHISIKHEEKQVEQALNIIHPILFHNKIGGFKYVNMKNDWSHFGNPNGKELVIYFQTWDDKSYESYKDYIITLLSYIEMQLRQKNILPHPSGASAALYVPGSRFSMQRDATNCSGHYLPWSYLLYFTRQEAARTRAGYTLLGDRGIIQIEPKLPILKAPNIKIKDGPLCVAKNFPAAIEIVAEIEKSITLFPGGIEGNMAFIFYLLIGDDYHCYIHDNALGLMFEYFAPGFNYRTDKVDKIKLVAQMIAPLAPYIDKAKQKLSEVYKQFEQNHLQLPTNTLGSAAPAFYYYFFVPVYAALRADGALTVPEAIARIDEGMLINQIVRCCLRNSTITPIYHVEPQYVCGLSEKQVSEYLGVPPPEEKEAKEQPLIDPAVKQKLVEHVRAIINDPQFQKLSYKSARMLLDAVKLIYKKAKIVGQDEKAMQPQGQKIRHTDNFYQVDRDTNVENTSRAIAEFKSGPGEPPLADAIKKNMMIIAHLIAGNNNEHTHAIFHELGIIDGYTASQYGISVNLYLKQKRETYSAVDDMQEFSEELQKQEKDEQKAFVGQIKKEVSDVAERLHDIATKMAAPGVVSTLFGSHNTVLARIAKLKTDLAANMGFMTPKDLDSRFKRLVSEVRKQPEWTQYYEQRLGPFLDIIANHASNETRVKHKHSQEAMPLGALRAAARE